MNVKSYKKVLLVSILSFITLFSAIIGIGSLTGKQITAKAAILSDEVRAENGLSFNATERYLIDEDFKQIPKTVEAYISLSGTGRHGAIISSFGVNGSLTQWNNPSFAVEVNANGVPRIYYRVPTSATTAGQLDIPFDETFLPTDGTWAHLVVIHDGTTAKCYINGELKQTETVQAVSHSSQIVTSIGGDFRTDNGKDNQQYFKGNIKSVECYADVRTDAEIKADYQRLLTAAPVDNDLLCAYNFTQSGRKYLEDLSQNDYDIEFTGGTQADLNGMSFANAENFYQIEKELATIPKTIEAEIYVPTSMSSRPGVIFGNYIDGDSTSNLNLEIHEKGKVRFRYGEKNNVCDAYASGVDVRTGDWVHLTIVHDEVSGQNICYINGANPVVMTTTQYKAYASSISKTFRIGGDFRQGNLQNFKGLIRSIALFEDARTAEEVKLDATNGVNKAEQGLLAYYNMPRSNDEKDIEDLSQNGYTVDFYRNWFTNKEEVKDYAYSFAVVGDTQCLTEKNETSLNNLYDWILANKEEKKIAHVFGLGDITQSAGYTDAVQEKEWGIALNTISKLDGNISYSLVRGNHDKSDYFNEYFNYDAYTGQFNGFYKENKIDSWWRTFTVAETDYLFIGLNYGADDAELNWAASIIEAFPNHKVIITTHAYLYRDGTTLSMQDVCSPSDSSDWTVEPYKVFNNGDQMWEKLVSKYGNIFLVLSGHDPCEDVITTQTKGIHGNTVTQMLIDPQGMDAATGTYPNGTGMVCMLYFSEDGTKIEVEWYSTVKNAYYKDINQYTINVSNEELDVHSFDSYEYDEEMHWAICSDCGQTKQGAHVYGEWEEVLAPTLTTPGRVEKTCECGHKLVQVITDYGFGNAFGASLRVSDPMGMRFRLQIKDKATIFDGTGTKQLGMFIFPAAWVDSANGDYASINPKIDIKFTESDVYKDGDSYYVNGVISNMYLQNTAIEFIGVGYIATTENEVTTYEYSTFQVENNGRSVLDVAIAAYKDVNSTVNKDTLINIIEKAIYAKYGVVETRDNGVVTFSYNGTNYSSYEEMKLANPITLALNVKDVVTIDEKIELKTLVKVNGTTVDISLPVSYEFSNGISKVNGGIVAKEAGIQNVTATFGEYVVSKDFEAFKGIDGIILDGQRDEKYGDFTDKVILSDGRWYTISAVKTENGVFIYTQALFNTTVAGDPGVALAPTWNNSTNFEFKIGGAISTSSYTNQYYVNIIGQNKGVDSFTFDVEEVNGKYLHTFEIFVSKALIEKWSDTEDLQLNYAWMSTDEKASMYSDMIDYQYLSNWGNDSNFHAYHRLGGTSTGFNDLVANLFVSENGLVANECDIATMDGVIDATESAMFGVSELNKTTTDTTVNVKGTVKDGDIYIAITVTHKTWSAYNKEWHKNDNFEMYIGNDHVIVMFLNGVPCVPAYFDSYGVATTEVGGKLHTVLELYKKGNNDKYDFRINANGANFGWVDILWNTTPNSKVLSEKGFTDYTSGNEVVEGVKIDGIFDDSVYTSVVRDYSFTTNANGATINVMGVMLEKGIIFATSIVTTKDANTSVDGSDYAYTYTNPEFYANGKSLGFITTRNEAPRNNTNLIAYCNSVNNGNGTYTHSFEYYIAYSDIGADIDSNDEIPFAIGGWFETGWKWIDGGFTTTTTHTLTNYGIKEMWEKMSTAEFYNQAAAFATPGFNSTVRARIAFSVKMMAGTKFTFIGDQKVYTWAVNENEINSQKPTVDKGWITDETTYTTTKDLYPVIVLKKNDGSSFTTEERLNLHKMFVVDGYKISSINADNEGAITQEEVNSQFVRFGNVYHDLTTNSEGKKVVVNPNRASIVFAMKVAKGAKVTYLGSSSFNWAVCEMKNNTGTKADHLLVDSGWNNESAKFEDTTTYIVKNDSYLVISLKKTSGNFAIEELVGLSELFKVEGQKIPGSNMLPTTTSDINSIAHRGYSTVAPENTLSAYRLAAQNGFTMVECDVQFTSDGVPVLLHDSTIDRTSNGSGNIEKMTFEQARSYEYGGWKSSVYYGEQIPSFSEFIDLCKELNLHPYIEIKGELSAEYAKVLVDIVTEKGMLDNVTWISFGAAGLSEIVKLDDTARIGYVVNNVTETVIDTAKTLQTGKNEVFVNNWHNCDANEIQLCKDAGIKLEVWYIDDVSTILGVNEYISGITSNWLVAGMYIG